MVSSLEAVSVVVFSVVTLSVVTLSVVDSSVVLEAARPTVTFADGDA